MKEEWLESSIKKPLHKVSEPREGAPFPSSLIPHEGDYSKKIFQIKGHPEQVIRAISFIPEEGELRAEAVVKAYKQARETSVLFRELQEKYNIPVAVQYVVGKNEEGVITTYTIAEQIEGLHLEKIGALEKFLLENPKEKENLKLAFSKHFSSLFNYFFDKLSERGPCLWDIAGVSQCVYGKRPGDTKPSLYLVDVDAFISKNSGELGSAIGSTVIGLHLVERDIGEPLAEPRKILKVAFNEAPGNAKHAMWESVARFGISPSTFFS